MQERRKLLSPFGGSIDAYNVREATPLARIVAGIANLASFQKLNPNTEDHFVMIARDAADKDTDVGEHPHHSASTRLRGIQKHACRGRWLACPGRRFGIGIKSVNAGVKYKDDAANKVAAGGVEVFMGVAKFAVGKAAGKAGLAIEATLGSAILPPVGTIVGGVIDGAVAGLGSTTLMNMGEAALKNCGAHDALVKGFGKVNRAVGGFVSSGFKR